MIWLALKAFAVETFTHDLPEDETVEAIKSVGDTDGDGYEDLVIEGWLYGLIWVPGSVNGPDMSRFRVLQGPRSSTEKVWGSAAAAGDHDGDGFDDVAVLDGETLMVYRGEETGLSTRPWRTTTVQYGKKIRYLDDINGDGLGEFGVSTPKGIFVYRGGSARLTHHTFVATPQPATDFGVFDNFDGPSSDVLMVGYDSSLHEWQVYVLPRTGTWTWGAATHKDGRAGQAFNPPIATDGPHAAVYITGLSSREDRIQNPYAGFFWQSTRLGLLRSGDMRCPGAFSQAQCGTDIAVFDLGDTKATLSAGYRNLWLDSPDTGTFVDLGYSLGTSIENVGDLDGDGLDDLVGWIYQYGSFSFVSGADLDLE